MREFFCILRKFNSGAPYTFTLKAATVELALDKMLEQTGVRSSSMEVEEYEVLEVLDGNRYIPVAQKFKQNNKGIQVYQPSPRPVIPLPSGEKEYTPYHKLVG